MPPPPFVDLYFFPQVKYNEWVRAAGEKFSAFFLLQFCIFQVNWGKNMQTFHQLGKNMHFPPFFHPLSIIFFPQHNILSYFCPPGGGVKQKNIHPWLPAGRLFCISAYILATLGRTFLLKPFGLSWTGDLLDIGRLLISSVSRP